MSDVQLSMVQRVSFMNNQINDVDVNHLTQNSFGKSSESIKKPDGDEPRQRLASVVNFSPTKDKEAANLRQTSPSKSKSLYYSKISQKKLDRNSYNQQMNESVESNDAQDEDIRESMVEKKSINLPTGYVLATKSNSKTLIVNKQDVKLSDHKK